MEKAEGKVVWQGDSGWGALERYGRHPSGMSVGQLVFRRVWIGGEKKEVCMFTEPGKCRAPRAEVLKFCLARFRITWRACQNCSAGPHPPVSDSVVLRSSTRIHTSNKSQGMPVLPDGNPTWRTTSLGQ